MTDPDETLPSSEGPLPGWIEDALPHSTGSFFRPGEKPRLQPAPGLAPGKVVGDFRLVSMIGQGGMGQ